MQQQLQVVLRAALLQRLLPCIQRRQQPLQVRLAEAAALGAAVIVCLCRRIGVPQQLVDALRN